MKVVVNIFQQINDIASLLHFTDLSGDCAISDNFSDLIQAQLYNLPATATYVIPLLEYCIP